VLAFPPGLEFIVALFACMIARVIAVPMMVPRRNTAATPRPASSPTASPRLALTTAELLGGARGDVMERFAEAWSPVDRRRRGRRAGGSPAPAPVRSDIAFLQYNLGIDRVAARGRGQSRQPAVQSGDGADRLRQYPALHLCQAGFRSTTTWGSS